MNNPRRINEIMGVVIPDLFERSRSQARADSVAAAQRELPKLCGMLDLNPATLKPNIAPVKALRARIEKQRAQA